MRLEALKNKIIAAAIFLKAKLLLVVKSEITKIGALIFFVITLLTVVAPIFFDNSALKMHAAQKVSQLLGSNLVIKGDVKIALLPHPKITAHEVILQNYKPKTGDLDSPKIYDFYAKSVEVIFPIFNFGNNVSVNKIIFNDAILESHFDNPDQAQHQDALMDILNQNKNLVSATQPANSGLSNSLFSIDKLKLSDTNSSKIPDISIINGQRIIYDFFGKKREIKNINADIEMNKKRLLADGNFISDGVISEFNINAKFNSTSKSPRSSIEIISPVMRLTFKGNFSSPNEVMEKALLDHDFSGKIEIDISELRSFYRSYINDTDVLASKLRFNGQPINLTADIENKNGEGMVENLKIKSGLITGSGEIHLSQNGKIPLIDIDINMENLDLDNILSGEVVSGQDATIDENSFAQNTEDENLSAQGTTTTDQGNNSDQVETKPAKTINLDITRKIKDFDLTAEIKAKNVKYFNGQITDANLYLTVSKEGEILVMPLIFNIPGEGIFRVNGAVDNSTATSKFIGKIDAKGKNLGEVFKWLQLQSQNLKLENLKTYSLYSDVLLLPNTLALNDFYLSVNDDASEILGDVKIDNGGKVLNTESHFKISNFDVNDYFFISAQNIYLTPGLLLKKLLWLNNISSNNSFDLTFDKLIYGDETFPNQSLKLRYGHGYFDLYDANFKSDKTALSLNLSVDTSNQDPHFELKIDAQNFEYKTPPQKSDSATIARNFFDQFYALPSLEEFNGKISLNFDNLNIDDVAIKNLKLNGILKDGNLTNTEFVGNIYEGDIIFKGLLGLKINKTVNGNFTYSNVLLKPFLSDAFGIKNISGVANFSANVTSVSDTKSGFAKTLTSEVKFIANTPTVDGYGLTDLIKKMFASSANYHELQNPEAILQNDQTATAFKQAKGSFAISGGQGGKIKIDLNAPALNAILSGSFDPINMTVDCLFNAIFLTGNTQKQVPINIATSIKGKTDKIQQSANLDQVRQYLGLAKVMRPNSAEVTAQDKSPLPNAQIQNNDMPAPAPQQAQPKAAPLQSPEFQQTTDHAQKMIQQSLEKLPPQARQDMQSQIQSQLDQKNIAPQMPSQQMPGQQKSQLLPPATTNPSAQ